MPITRRIPIDIAQLPERTALFTDLTDVPLPVQTLNCYVEVLHDRQQGLDVSLEADLAKASSDLAARDATIEQLKEDATTLTATYNTLAEEREQLRSRDATLQGDVTQLEECAEQDRDLISTMKQEVTKYGANFVDALQQTIDERNVEISSLKGEVSAKSDALLAAKQLWEAAQDTASAQDEALVARDEVLIAQREQLAENITELSAYKTELKKHRDEIVRCTQNNIGLQDQYKGKTDELREEKAVLIKALADALKRAGPEKMAASQAHGPQLGDRVQVFDRYRFASSPLVTGKIVTLASVHGNGFEVDVGDCSNPEARRLQKVWVSEEQVRVLDESRAADHDADSSAPVDKGSPEKPQVGDVWRAQDDTILTVLGECGDPEFFRCSAPGKLKDAMVKKSSPEHFHQLMSRDGVSYCGAVEAVEDRDTFVSELRSARSGEPVAPDSDETFTLTYHLTPEEIAARNASSASLAKKRRSFIERFVLARAAVEGDNYERSFQLAVEAWVHIQSSIGGAS